MLTEEEKNAGLEGKIIPINIEEQMKSAYIDYSMSVIVSRALPDVRDGLKPVHRRILYDMSAELNLYSDKPTRKSARIVGDVLGKFHPHGDSSVYGAMVRMAQDWSMRYPLVDGQGNFGSMDGDSPAAMRYTEARMQKITDEVMADIDKDTIDWTLNFDDTIPEPTVLPTKIPLLLVNGASGIAVGMATNMAPHNLGEVIDACCAFVDNPEIACEELLKYVKGPDFPTGGIIYGYEGVREALLTGRGRVVMRARTEIEHTASGRECIVITEIPYMVNKAEMIKKIADLINEKKIEGISYINDESDRNGMRIIVILKHDAVASVVLNTLYKNTPLQTSFAVNNIALVNGRPMMLNLLDLVQHFVEHRHDVIVRRTRFDLARPRRGCISCWVCSSRRTTSTRSSTSSGSQEPRLGQAGHDGALQLERRTGFGHYRDASTRSDGTRTRQAGCRAQRAGGADRLFQRCAGSRELQMKIVKDELLEVKAKYGDERRSEIVYASEEFNPRISTPTTRWSSPFRTWAISNVRRWPNTVPRTGRRRRQGQRDARRGFHRAYLYGHDAQYDALLHGERPLLLAQGLRDSRRDALLERTGDSERHPDRADDKVRAYINVKRLDDAEYVNNNYIIMCTKDGTIKKTKLEAYSRPRQNGVNAIVIREGDQLIEAKLTSGSAEVMIAAREGKAIRFNENTVRPIGRVGPVCAVFRSTKATRWSA